MVVAQYLGERRLLVDGRRLVEQRGRRGCSWRDRAGRRGSSCRRAGLAAARLLARKFGRHGRHTQHLLRLAHPLERLLLLLRLEGEQVELGRESVNLRLDLRELPTLGRLAALGGLDG